MSNSEFKSIKNEVDVCTSSTGATSWTIPSDRHVSVVTVAYDENSAPNQIAALPKGHPIKKNYNADAIRRDPAVALKNDPKNYYHFTINTRVQKAEFNETAQEIIANKLLPHLIDETLFKRESEIILYPTTGNEFNVKWMMDALSKKATDSGVTVKPTSVMLAQKKKVDGISILLVQDAEAENGAAPPNKLTPA